MIRDRREQDLDRLCEILAARDADDGVLAGRSPRAWLSQIDAEVSWVFDQAPVSVAPTRNVVGHLQVYRPPVEAAWTGEAATAAGVDVAGLLVIGRMFVKPMKHDHGVARYLLTEAVKLVKGRGSVAVLDPDGAALVPVALARRLGLSDGR
ncbi:GNAT family N-acetyltransferase [Nocardioides carbamazepini]|uniref:GNAT family N-acetyltransferase n=1 Tax=Nocardioides carbamazepini TaxID=2854259 RepID=UPI00214A306A|nr:GNAT family N-acetyltransferase [Nocardioides carbamazepini]MCR1780941.1 GNAT family N-acetyltransferase [Nocardioides carbamazepini]